MEQRKMERRKVQAHFYNPPEERRRGQDRRGVYRAQLEPGAIRPAFNTVQPARERRTDRSSGME